MRNQEKVFKEVDGDSSDDTVDSYRRALEKRLKQALEKMDGVGQVEVMITLKDGGESIVEKDVNYSSDQQTEQQGDVVTERNQTESQETTVYHPDSQEGNPFIAKENVPAVEGVLIIAQGGNNTKVAANISEAVQALFGLEAHKIKIVKMNTVQEGS